jgi:hypothetical protein
LAFFDVAAAYGCGAEVGLLARMCDSVNDAVVEDIVRVDGKLQTYKRLVAPVVSLDNEDQVVTAMGPGEVRIIQLGTADQSLPGPPPSKSTGKPVKPGPPSSTRGSQEPKQEPYLTHVRFSQQMQAFKPQGTAYFYGDVEVVHLPSDQPELKIKIDPLPERCMYLKCNKLSVYSHTLPNGQRNQEMEARGHVVVQAQEFYGLADVVKYDENLDRVIFEGADGSPAKESTWQTEASRAHQPQRTPRSPRELAECMKTDCVFGLD